MSRRHAARQLLRILLVEDAEQDAELLMRALRKEGIKAQFERVQNVADLRAALQRQPWDAVIADFRLPGFSGLDALGMVRAAGLDIPFILLSGTIGEEAVVDVMKAGANDFVTKENLQRLAPALKRELQETAVRAAHRQAERDLIESEQAEVHGHDLDDRTHARDRRPDPGSHERRLGERGVADALRSELVEESTADAEASAVAPDVHE